MSHALKAPVPRSETRVTTLQTIRSCVSIAHARKLTWLPATDAAMRVGFGPAYRLSAASCLLSSQHYCAKTLNFV